MDPFAEFYFQQEEEQICDLPVSSITEEYIESHLSIVDRYFTRYYYLKPGPKHEPYLVLFHSNRVCMICLAPEHPVFKDGIAGISFNIGNLDRSKNQVSGKGKKGGMILQQDSTLAVVTGKDGQTYKVPSCIKGKLIEVNPRIIKNPELMAQSGDGYLAIVLPKPSDCDKIRESLLTEKLYRSHLEAKRCRDISGIIYIDMDPLDEFYFQQEEEQICGLPVSSITEEYIENHLSIVDRYFTPYYYLKPGPKTEPYLVLFHQNRVCMICLAPEHPVFEDGIAGISFNIGNLDRSKNQVSGKGKKGGMILQQDSTLAVVTGKDGQSYKVPSCIKGKLIEVNPRIIENPELMAQSGDGYLAIVIPKSGDCIKIRESLLSDELYRLHLEAERNGDILGIL